MSQDYRLTPVVAGPPAKKMKPESDLKLQLVGSQNNLTMASGGQALSSSGSLNSTSSQAIENARPSYQPKEGVQKGASSSLMAPLSEDDDDAAFKSWCFPVTYTCNICSDNGLAYTHIKLQGLYNHIRSVHDLTSGEYNEQYPSMKSTHPFFRCKICENVNANSKMHHDEQIMTKHFKKTHKGALTLREYYDKFVINDGALKDEDVAFKKFCHPIFHKCAICKVYETKSYKVLQQHVRSAHSYTYNVYQATYNTDKQPRHMCAICGKFVIQDSNEMATHFKSYCTVKGIDLKEYFLKHVYDGSASDTSKRQ